jgi:hypothetical protein
VTFGTPTTPAPDTPPTPASTPVSGATPGTATPPPAADDDGIMDAVMDALKKYGSSTAVAAFGKMIADWRTGRQEGRKDELDAAAKDNQQNLSRYIAGVNSNTQDLNQRIYLGDNYDRNAKNAIKGDYMQGVEDINIPRPEGVSSRNITGGLRPSAFPNRKAIGDAMEKEAMTELLDPTRVASDPRPGTKRLPALPTMPDKIDVAGPGWLDSVLDYAGMGASALPFIQALIKETTPKPAPATTPSTIAAPDPLVPQIPTINTGETTVDPNGSLIDTLRRRRTGAGSYFADPRF